jgi:hypothetical protein
MAERGLHGWPHVSEEAVVLRGDVVSVDAEHKLAVQI